MSRPHETTSNRISIHIWHPTIKGTQVKSKEQLHEIINTKYPGIKINPDFPNLLYDAEIHLDIIRRLEAKNNIEIDTRNLLFDEFDITYKKMTTWTQAARQPRLYYLIDNSIPKTEAQESIRKINQENNGLCSSNDVLKRLETYYSIETLAQSNFHYRRVEQVDKYFEVLKQFKNGGLYSDIAREANVPKSTTQQWCKNRTRPDLVHLARNIPDKIPSSGNKWLPITLKVGQGFIPINFIQVPEKIDNWKQIQNIVLKQLTELENDNMIRWYSRFGEITKEEAFSYLLGILVSDARKIRKFTSGDMSLDLSKTYDWSEQVGEAVCYYFGKIGIHVVRRQEENPHIYRWGSQRTPLVNWMMKTCLGLNHEERTSINPIQVDWLLKAPKEIRLKFLQGLNDGDGCACAKNMRLSIACGVNHKFVQSLLNTFNIDSNFLTEGRGLLIYKVESIIRATYLSFFLHATGRQDTAEKMVDMINARRVHMLTPISEEIMEYMLKQHQKGFSNGEIAVQIFEKFQISYSKDRVRMNIIKSKLNS